jgi:site-specific DNA-cytosine methylase
MGKTNTAGPVNTGAAEITALEFYSGIGGMHAALTQVAGRTGIGTAEVLAAFDVNEVANRIYGHNFGVDLVKQVCTATKRWS